MTKERREYWERSECLGVGRWLDSAMRALGTPSLAVVARTLRDLRAWRRRKVPYLITDRSSCGAELPHFSAPLTKESGDSSKRITAGLGHWHRALS
eukprot:scaffold146101_cov34-Tisochrysis_lutea.AAC.1